MIKLWPSLLGAAQVVQPETILRWHRAGFKAYWRWKSRNRAGRPKIDRGLRDVIRRMSRENPRWGASRIHGELLMLGFEVAQSTVSKYMVRRRNPPSQTGKTFLRNHAEGCDAILFLPGPAGMSVSRGTRLELMMVGLAATFRASFSREPSY